MRTEIKLRRWLRLWLPKQNDHAAWMLMNALGRWWLLLHGWKREYRVYRNGRMIIIDLAHPRLKLALEADGERWHMDIVKEQTRDELLKANGWSVKHYRYPAIKNESKRVRREVRVWYWQHKIKRPI